MKRACNRSRTVHTSSAPGFANDQIKWYRDSINALDKASPDTKISLACHIQPYAFEEALRLYEYSLDPYTSPINIDKDPYKLSTDFGYVGEPMVASWDGDFYVWDDLSSLGMDSMFVGHIHASSASLMFGNIRCHFGLKSSMYDRVNYRTVSGAIVSAYERMGDPVIGGSVIVLTKDTGELKDVYHYYTNGRT